GAGGRAPVDLPGVPARPVCRRHRGRGGAGSGAGAAVGAAAGRPAGGPGLPGGGRRVLPGGGARRPPLSRERRQLFARLPPDRGDTLAGARLRVASGGCMSRRVALLLLALALTDSAGANAPRTDALGDPLPPAARARFG